MEHLFVVTVNKIYMYYRNYDFIDINNKIQFLDGHYIYRGRLDTETYFRGERVIATYDADKRFDYQEQLRKV